MSNTAITRTVFGVGGAALLLRGVFIIHEIIKPSQWPEILIWFAAGVLLHDVIIAPITLLLGRIVRPGPVVAAGWMGAGVVLLLSYPLVKGAKFRQNPTVIPQSPALGLTRALAAVAIGMLIAWVIRFLLRRRVQEKTPA